MAATLWITLFAFTAILLIFDLSLLLRGKPTISQLGARHPIIPLIYVVLAALLFHHFWGSP